MISWRLYDSEQELAYYEHTPNIIAIDIPIGLAEETLARSGSTYALLHKMHALRTNATLQQKEGGEIVAC